MIRLRVNGDPLGEDVVYDMPEGDMFRDALEDLPIACARIARQRSTER